MTIPLKNHYKSVTFCQLPTLHAPPSHLTSLLQNPTSVNLAELLQSHAQHTSMHSENEREGERERAKWAGRLIMHLHSFQCRASSASRSPVHTRAFICIPRRGPSFLRFIGGGGPIRKRTQVRAAKLCACGIDKQRGCRSPRARDLIV